MKISFLAKICLIWGIFWGALSTLLFFLGLANLWYKPVLIFVFLFSLLGLFYYLKKIGFGKDAKVFFQNGIWNLKKDKIVLALSVFILLVAVFYLFGALAPEKEFDALWYHLTLPKIFLNDHSVHFIPGGLFYYSVMPQLAEMLYGLTLAILSNGILAKLLEFLFGVFWLIFSYDIFRMFFTKRLSLLLVAIIFSLPIVCFLSTTAYIDLIVSFYVAGIIWAYLNYQKTKDMRFLYLAGIFAGFNLAAKIYGLMIVAVVGLLLLLQKDLKPALIFGGLALLLVLPYYLHAYLATGNPFYPVFSVQDQSYFTWINGAASYKEWLLRIWPTRIVGLTWRVFVYEFAPLLGLIFLLPFFTRRQETLIKQLSFILLLFFIIWSLNPVWEPRYLIVILPVMAVLLGIVVTKLNFPVAKIFVGFLIILGLIQNFQTNWLYLMPAYRLVGKLSNEQYLDQYVGSSWYNFYDEENVLDTNSSQKLLTINYHNLFYAPQDSVDWSYFSLNINDNLMEKLKEANIKYVAITEVLLKETLNLKESDEKNFELVWQKGNEKFYKVMP